MIKNDCSFLFPLVLATAALLGGCASTPTPTADAPTSETRESSPPVSIAGRYDAGATSEGDDFWDTGAKADVDDEGRLVYRVETQFVTAQRAHGRTLVVDPYGNDPNGSYYYPNAYYSQRSYGRAPRAYWVPVAPSPNTAAGPSAPQPISTPPAPPRVSAPRRPSSRIDSRPRRNPAETGRSRR